MKLRGVVGLSRYRFALLLSGSAIHELPKAGRAKAGFPPLELSCGGYCFFADPARFGNRVLPSLFGFCDRVLVGLSRLFLRILERLPRSGSGFLLGCQLSGSRARSRPAILKILAPLPKMGTARGNRTRLEARSCRRLRSGPAPWCRRCRPRRSRRWDRARARSFGWSPSRGGGTGTGLL